MSEEKIKEKEIEEKMNEIITEINSKSTMNLEELQKIENGINNIRDMIYAEKVKREQKDAVNRAIKNAAEKYKYILLYDYTDHFLTIVRHMAENELANKYSLSDEIKDMVDNKIREIRNKIIGALESEEVSKE